MKKAIQPYLHFDDNCREAMQFYQNLFGGNLEIMTIAESPAKEQFPEDLHNQVMHATLSNRDFKLMASDMCGQGKMQRGNGIQLSLNCSSEDEIKRLYGLLSEGGQVEQELAPQFWGSLFAMLVDKFGIKWMLSLEGQ